MYPTPQAPRFGNGRTITDLAKRIFTEISVRVEGGGKGQSDPRASVNDIRRSTAGVLQQMSRVSRTASGQATNTPTRNQPAAFSTSGQLALPPPTSKTTTSTVMTAEPEENNKDAEKVEEPEIPDVSNHSTDDFLSATDLKTLTTAMSIAEIAEDSPDINVSNPDLRRALLLPRAAGGIDLSPKETESFLRRVSTDRAALARAGREGPKVDEANVSRINTVEREVVDTAEAVTTAIENGADKETIDLLEALKRAKEEALKKAKEERERQQALERAAQAALRRMGVCVAGFRWIQQGNGGWRCAGGSHYVSGAQVAAEMAHGGSS